MKIQEWMAISTDLEVTIGKPFADGRSKKYFSLLQDLPAMDVTAAVKKILSTRVFQSIPSVGEIRRATGHTAPTRGDQPADAWTAWSSLFLAGMSFRRWQDESFMILLGQLKDDRLRNCAESLGKDFIRKMADGDNSEPMRARFGIEWAAQS